MIFSGSQQIIEELCEHCGEKVRDVHISEITVKKPNDPRTIDIRDKDNVRQILKLRKERILELSGSYKRKQLLDDTEAEEASQIEKFKYGLRAEAMCSESIDIDNAITQSFCYRVEENPQDVRFQKVVGGRTLSASLALANKSDSTGSRMGVDRKGNVIKMNRYKNLRLDKPIGKEEVIKDSDTDQELQYKKGAYKTSWFEALTDEQQKRVIESTQNCRLLATRFPDEVKSMEIVARARDIVDFDVNFIRANGCRL